MNPRYVLMVCGLIVTLAALVAEEGGPLDSIASNAPAAPDEAAADTPQIAASGPPSPAEEFASGSDFGIGDYEIDDGGYGPAPVAAAPSQWASSAPGGTLAAQGGALTDEQLGVEKATGLAPIAITGA